MMWAVQTNSLFLHSAEHENSIEVTEPQPVDVSPSSLSSKSPADPTMVFFSMDYGKTKDAMSESIGAFFS